MRPVTPCCRCHCKKWKPIRLPLSGGWSPVIHLSCLNTGARSCLEWRNSWFYYAGCQQYKNKLQQPGAINGTFHDPAKSLVLKGLAGPRRLVSFGITTSRVDLPEAIVIEEGVSPGLAFHIPTLANIKSAKPSFVDYQMDVYAAGIELACRRRFWVTLSNVKTLHGDGFLERTKVRLAYHGMQIGQAKTLNKTIPPNRYDDLPS